jgi:hypothetical protein
VIRDQVLWLPDELHELADAPIAATELDDQLPSERTTEQPKDLRRLRRSRTLVSFDGRRHGRHSTSRGFDVSSAFDVSGSLAVRSGDTKRHQSEGLLGAFAD